jgi:hypothetical protein
MNTSRFRLGEAPSILHWDGTTLHGTATARAVVVTVPLRLAAVRVEHLPPAAPTALRAAARLKAERAFAPLGPAAIDAIISTPAATGVTALLIALPKPVISAIRTALAERDHTLAALRIAELLLPVPVGGVVVAHGEACLIASQADRLSGLAALGRTDHPEHAIVLARERLRLDVAEDAPPLPPPGAHLDFLAPTLNAAEPMLQRRAFRLGILAAGLAALLLLGLGMFITDALSERSAAQAEAARLRPLAKTLAARRSELAEVAPWFDARPSPTPGLAVLAAALPPLGGSEQVHLIRVRQVAGEDAVAEATAADRNQMMAFLERLRRDPRVEAAAIRSSRNPSKEARTVVFELILRLTGGSRAAS